jgi:hypothetical protein
MTASAGLTPGHSIEGTSVGLTVHGGLGEETSVASSPGLGAGDASVPGKAFSLTGYAPAVVEGP